MSPAVLIRSSSQDSEVSTVVGEVSTMVGEVSTVVGEPQWPPCGWGVGFSLEGLLPFDPFLVSDQLDPHGCVDSRMSLILKRSVWES